jgi:hypothetical protein
MPLELSPSPIRGSVQWLWIVRILIVHAAMVCYNYTFADFVDHLLGASVNVDYNLCRRASASWPTCSSRFSACDATY